mmetsp:Transcript_3938/g.12774  ORF Transcript_3938/g.12774 Transcript_3938/m.12774 type:complete len:204 (+) Transcript_3938:3521-4132(+)
MGKSRIRCSEPSAKYWEAETESTVRILRMSSVALPFCAATSSFTSATAQDASALVTEIRSMDADRAGNGEPPVVPRTRTVTDSWAMSSTMFSASESMSFRFDGPSTGAAAAALSFSARRRSSFSSCFLLFSFFARNLGSGSYGRNTSGSSISTMTLPNDTITGLVLSDVHGTFTETDSRAILVMSSPGGTRSSERMVSSRNSK